MSLRLRVSIPSSLLHPLRLPRLRVAGEGDDHVAPVGPIEPRYSRKMSAANDSAFARAFERGEIPPADFHHASHLRLALAYLDECSSIEEATDRMAASIKRFAR